MTERRRGQAITLNYTLGIAITVILVTGLLIVGGDFVQDQRERAARAELEVIGQQVSSDLATADRLVQSTESDPQVALRRSIPRQVAGSPYEIELVADPDPVLELSTDRPDVGVTVALVNETDFAGATVDGGALTVNHTASGKLTLERGANA